MKITLKNLSIQHFKGIPLSIINFNGRNATISGENGEGKTTVYDAFLWLLFGKDSDGKTDFGVRPVDENNQSLKDVIVQVIGVLDFDGEEHSYRKEQHEKAVKGQTTGYENLCWIDDVPKKVSEYNRQIQDLIPEGIFKVLTDLRYFSEKLSWLDRRKVLLEIAGDSGKPKGFEGLIAELKNREIGDYKKVLSDQKKRYVKERDDIPPRIDELHKGLAGISVDAPETVKAQRDTLQAEIDNYEAQIASVMAKEKVRQEQLESLNKLKVALALRENALVTDSSGNQFLLDERAKIEAKVADAEHTTVQYEQQIKTFQAKKQTAEVILKGYQDNLEMIRGSYHTLQAAKLITNCSLCGQVLPTDRIEEMRDKRTLELERLTGEGEEIQHQVSEQAKLIEQINTQVGSAVKMHNEAIGKAKNLKTKTDIRIAEINEALKSKTKPDPKKDVQWLAIKEKIDQAEETVEPATSEELIRIEKERNEKNAQIKVLNDTLAQSDRIDADRARIKELEECQRQLAQTIANLEKQLAQVGEYEAAESKLIEDNVNGKFKSARFKLFKELLNGGFEPCCEVTYDGRIWPDTSSGEKIFIGLDIVNTLSMHYGFSLPLFIDHRESVSLPLDTHMQAISLKMVEGQELKIEVEK